MNINQKLDTIINLLQANPEQQDAICHALEASGILDAVTGSGSAVAAQDHTGAEHQRPEVTIRNMLIELGTPCHVKGYYYLSSAIYMATKEPDIITMMTKRLYPSVADKFETTPSRVERAIRHAVELTWDRGDLDVLRQYFGNTISPSKGKPTNSEFIARVAETVRMRMESMEGDDIND